MAIAEMSKMTLIGLKTDEAEIVSALHKTCMVQLFEPKTILGTEKVAESSSDCAEKYDRLKRAYGLLFLRVSKLMVEKGEKLKDYQVEIKMSDFINSINSQKEVFDVCDKVFEIENEILKNETERAKLVSEKATYLPYEKIDAKFCDFEDTLFTHRMIGIMPENKARDFLNVEFDGLIFNILSLYNRQAVCSVVCLNNLKNEVNEKLSSLGFEKYRGEYTGLPKDKIEDLNKKIALVEDNSNEKLNEFLNYKDYLDKLKVLLDRYAFEIEKQKLSEEFLRTESTFLLEAYVPTLETDNVNSAVEEVTKTAFIEFEKIDKNDFAPTLLKNKNPTKQFEFVTNLYSPPKYGTIDSCTVMMWFFSIFMGFIMGDIGYGLIMTFGGLLFAKLKLKRDSGLRRLVYVIIIGGIFTIIFGVLFDSFFGYGLLRQLNIIDKTILPDPIKDKTSFSGISIPSLLLISLGLGVIQIAVGLVFKAAASFKEGKIFDGIIDGICWVLFLIGMMLAVMSIIGAINGLLIPSLVMCIGGVAVGSIFAGRHQKGFGKITKSFGAVYGLINYFSDILSYARLYGLMLSGAQIAAIVTDMALPMMSGITAIFGIIILFIGHAFNLAMGVLGAYIHDSRLQYVEFFGRFYEGEGELFKPFGTNFEHLYLIK